MERYYAVIRSCLQTGEETVLAVYSDPLVAYRDASGLRREAKFMRQSLVVSYFVKPCLKDGTLTQ
jgi:hypothetical protein